MAKKTTPKQTQRSYERFTLVQRVEHITMLLSFTALGFTGLLQKFASSSVSQFFISLMGGIESMRTIHRIAAVVMMLGAIYHIVAIAYKIFVLRVSMSMLPEFQDAKNALQAFLYNIGLAKARPQMGRYTFEEKAEYWAFVWGAAIMGLTGFFMWDPITATKFLPGEFIPAAKAAHGGEALLAVLAIIVWHMYGVHIKFFNKAMWTGQMTEEQMLHEHPLELADIKAGADKPVDATTRRRREKKFIPAAAILTVVLLLGVYGFIGVEETALTTIPPQAEIAQAFVPQTPTLIPTPIPIPTPTPRPPTPTLAAGAVPPAGTIWNGEVSAFIASECDACHIDKIKGGLSLATYADLLKGGDFGPAFIPGDSANSLIITKFESGDHPLEDISPELLALLKIWIDGGALEK